ncbi:MAG: ankyrin repeat domain-containing protein [Endozoicomonadaceae bacterium]|nr:ankyrin repeat domain-containing protein [Endozoicomonadaceae bacterium]
MKSYFKIITAVLFILITFSVHAHFGSTKEERLLILIRNNPQDFEKLRTYLSKHSDIINNSVKDEDGKETTPLIAAILKTNNLGLVKVLVNEFGADVNLASSGMTPLMHAFRLNKTDIAFFLNEKSDCSAHFLFSPKDHLGSDNKLSEDEFIPLEQHIIKRMPEQFERDWNLKKQEIESKYAQVQPGEEESTGSEEPAIKKRKMKPEDVEWERQYSEFQQELQVLIKEYETDSTDALDMSDNYFLSIYKKLFPLWCKLRDVSFVRSLLYAKKKDAESLKNLHKYTRMLLLIYNAIYKQSSLFSESILKQQMQDIDMPKLICFSRDAIQQDSKWSLVDAKKEPTSEDDFLAKNPKLKAYLEEINELPAAIPKELQIIIHFYIWSCGDLVSSEGVMKSLRKIGYSDDQITFINFGSVSKKKALRLELSECFNDIKKEKYSVYKEQFAQLIEKVYKQKIELLKIIS